MGDFMNWEDEILNFHTKVGDFKGEIGRGLEFGREGREEIFVYLRKIFCCLEILYGNFLL